MWGEFEDVGKKENISDVRDVAVSKQHIKVEEETLSDSEDELPPLRDRIIRHLASSSVTLKSQQRYEPDLTYKERETLTGELLEKPGQFLFRFGKHLRHEHMQYFLKFEGDPVVDHYVAETLKHMNKHTAKVIVRNRRYAAMQELRRSGNYFSEKEMERRDPLLYEQLIARHQTEEERRRVYEESDGSNSDIRFSSLLLQHFDNCSEKYLKEQQQEEEDDMLEEEDTDEEELEVEESEMENPVESREKQLFREEFYSSQYHNFLRGKDAEFDYGQVDASDAYDLLDIRARDEEERYFDEDDDDDDDDSATACVRDDSANTEDVGAHGAVHEHPSRRETTLGNRATFVNNKEDSDQEAANVMDVDDS